MSSDHDDLLMTGVREGDVSKLGILFERHHRTLYRFFVRLTNDYAASEDLVQDVFFRMLKYRATYRRGGPFRPWMFHIARTAHIDRFRSRAQELPLDEGAAEPAAADATPFARLERLQDTALLREALTRLPVEKREVLLLSRLEGLRYEQVAAILGCEVGAVKVRVYRAMRELRAAFEELSTGVSHGMPAGSGPVARLFGRHARES